MSDNWIALATEANRKWLALRAAEYPFQIKVPKSVSDWSAARNKFGNEFIYAGLQDEGVFVYGFRTQVELDEFKREFGL